MSIQSDKFKKFLATGVMPTETSVLDEAISEHEQTAEDYMYDPKTGVSLEEHDKRFHKGGYKKGDRCEFRKRLKIGDENDQGLEKKNEKSQDGDILSILKNYIPLADKAIEDFTYPELLQSQGSLETIVNGLGISREDWKDIQTKHAKDMGYLRKAKKILEDEIDRWDEHQKTAKKIRAFRARVNSLAQYLNKIGAEGITDVKKMFGRLEMMKGSIAHLMKMEKDFDEFENRSEKHYLKDLVLKD